MTEIIIPKHLDPHNIDKPKDCVDFVPLDDGTITRERKYCNLSFVCKMIGMLADRVEICDEAGNILELDYLCTGKHPIFQERGEDSKAK